MSAPDPAKIEKFRAQLHQEWTGEATVAGWRKWHAQISAFTRGATDAILETAQLRPGLYVLDLASGVGDPALAIAAKVGPSGRVIGTDLALGMISLAAELASQRSIHNIEFHEASAESLPFPDKSFDVVTCRFGVMFFPDLGKALRECFRVLKPGGRAAFVAWDKRDQPLFATTAGVLMKHVPDPPPPPDPDGPHLFMFGERDRLRRALEVAGFRNVSEEARTVNGRWDGTAEEYWEQFTDIAAPFRALVTQLTPERKAAAVAEVLAAVREFSNGRELNLPLEIVIGSGMRA